MPLEVTSTINHQAENYSKIITKLAEYQQKARDQQFVIATNTKTAIDQLFEDYDLLNMIDVSRLIRITPNRKITSGTASLQKMILFEIIGFNQFYPATNMVSTSLTFVVQKVDANYISDHLAKLLHNRPVMVLKRELPSINYDIHETGSIFSIELFTTLFCIDIQPHYIGSIPTLLEIMSDENVLNEFKATNINMLKADMLPLFYQKLRHVNDQITIDTISSVLPFIQKLSLAELL